MFITDREKLKNYTTEYRIWQGIPGIEVTKRGRVFSTFYSGGIKEELGNFAMLVMSDDGVNFSEPVAVAYDENHRCFDPCLWIDPLDRLWFIWSVMPDDDVWAVICDNPDADELVWSEPKVIGKGVMMNKPIVLSTGEWLFPIAVWTPNMKKEVENGRFMAEINETSAGSFAYRSIDNGESFEKLGGAEVGHRSYDEHMFLELKDGRIGNYIRTVYGVGVAYSYDGGKTWVDGWNSGFGGPCSRFYVGRLKSGRILLINHYKYTDRNNMTALLSEDEGKTWKYKLLLDERDWVSYPDVKEADDGFIYVTYDRERGAFKRNLEQAYNSAREILYAKITEEDIINGKITNPDSKLKCVISKLGKYKYEDSNPYKELIRQSDYELAELWASETVDDILAKIFDIFLVNSTNMKRFDNEKLDKMVGELKCGADKKKTLIEIIKLMRSVADLKLDKYSVVDKIKEVITENICNDLSLKEIADKAEVSESYLIYAFKNVIGISIHSYKNALRIHQAKRLLANTDKSITNIAIECGFESESHFSESFAKSEGVIPSKYRKLLKK